MRVMLRRMARNDDAVAWVATVLFYAALGLWIYF